MKFSSKLAMATGLALVLSTGVSFAQEFTLRCQHFISPKGAVPAGFMTPWAERIMEQSNGRIKVEIYPGMQLGGKPPALYDQIRDGVIDCGWALTGYTPGRFPESEAFELPFMTSNNAEATSKATWEYAEKYLMDRMQDVHLIATHVHGPGYVHKKGGPITSIADFKGLKLRGPSRQANAMLESLGATPVGMPVPAFPENLSKGVVDGGVIPLEIVPPLKIHELADSHTVVGGDRAMYNTFFIWAMNNNSYNQLPDDLKAVIDANSGLEASGMAGRAMDLGDAAGMKVIQSTDNALTVMDDATTAEIQAIGAKQTAAWIAEMESKGLPGQAMVDDVRAMVEKYSQ